MNGRPIDPATFAALIEMTGGDLAFVDDLVDTYLEEGAGLVAALQAGSAGPADGLVRPAHSLKSSSLNVGALELGGLCRDLEEQARSGPVSDPAERVAAIAAGFADVRTALLADRQRRVTG
ncbi:MAG TPA: Hpt domain-containing protein [Candidatus Limnocylindrales bacterium]|jgi:HPt (histidine-containing phosphotransfer) domain-containing protein